jgi:DnaJ family protein C protein 2
LKQCAMKLWWVPSFPKHHLKARYSHEQHLSCAQALKQYKSDHPERWDRVANAVEGKTQKQCKDRYRELRNNFRAKKS